jgi:hypothetical protein
MASTYSDLKIELIGTGDQSGTWGTTTNSNLGNDGLGAAIAGSADVSFSSADVTLTLTDTVAAQSARNLRLNLTGTTGGARNLILGSGCQIEKPYLINNGTADTVTVKNTTGTGIAVPAGKSMWVYNNGTNVVDAVTHLTSLTLGSALPIASGGTGTTSTTFVNLTTNVTGDLPFANLAQGSALSVLGVTGNATADVASIAAGTDHQVLRRSGTSLAFGAVNLAQTAAITGTLPVGNGGTGITSLGTGVATWLGTPSSANLAAAVTDETGSGALVFGTSPTLTTPNIGVATATSVNKVTITAPATSATLTIANGKTLTANNSIALTGTDSTTMTFPSTSATIARTDSAQTFTGAQTFSTAIAVGSGGTGLSSGTSGGIPYFSASNTIASSAALAASAIVLGGGAGVAPATTTTGTGVVTAVGNAVNTTGGLVTQSGTLAANNILLGGGASTAITSSSLLAVSAAVTTGNFIKALGYADTVTALGNTGTAINIDLTSGNVFTATLTGSCTFTLRYPVSSGSSSFTLVLTNDGTAGRTVAWAGGSFLFPGGAASLSRSTAANAIDVWVFFTNDGGTTWYGNIAMKNMAA